MATITAIRCAEPGERKALGELHARSAFLWAEDRANLEAHPDALGVSPEAIASHRVRVAVGEGGELFGFSVVADGVGVCALDDLFVEPDAIGQRVGRALVQDAAARALAGGFRQMTVVAHPRNFPFYESLGFAPGESVQTRFGPAVRMRRDLSAPVDAVAREGQG